MSKSSSLLTMQRAIISYIKANLPENPNRAHLGRISGDRVIIKNKSYPYTPAVDLPFGTGSHVYCLLPDSGNMAAVVGVR